MQIVVFFLCVVLSVTTARANAYKSDILAEQQLVQALEWVQKGEFQSAISDVELLVNQHPNYRLARLMLAEFRLIQAGRMEALNRLRRKKQVQKLLQEAKVRWQFAHTPPSEQAFVKRYIWKQGEDPFMVFVDLRSNRLYLYQNQQGELSLVESVYITMGKRGFGKRREGDKRTPIGIYQIERWIPDKKLPDLYGVGALTLNYPNAWDQFLGRTGSGIWLHGTPANTFSRAPMDSQGCVVLDNEAMLRLVKTYSLKKHTPVLLIADQNTNLIDVNEDKDKVLISIRKWLLQEVGKSDFAKIWKKVGVYRYPGERGLIYVKLPKSMQQQALFWQQSDNGWRLARLAIEEQQLSQR